MNAFRRFVFLAIWVSTVRAEPSKPEPMPESSVEKIAAKVRPSLLTVINTGRQGLAQGIGTGFVISKDGLVATNLHVVGEARAIEVELQDGSRPKVTEVLAWSRKLDLVIFRMDHTDLPPLELGPPEKMPQGSTVVAMGNPLGLRYSVVSGVVSETREIDGQELIQIAMPIERGNSGGPLVDSEGRVRGIINMKNAVTENLGYAIPVKELQGLLARPAPVKMEHWLTIGALNPKLWKPLDAKWTQRAGRIRVQGMGESFGGRALCLHQSDPPPLPYEISVKVKLDDESGAAGLAFCSDGDEVHYGFYPTAGKLRLTRFQGPDVNSWHILQDIHSDHYKPGEWNLLHVRVEKEKLICSVNGHVVITSTDAVLRDGKAGLCKFRATEPEFKDFRIGPQVAAPNGNEADLAKLQELVARIGRGELATDAALDALTPNPDASREFLDRERKNLAERAMALEKLARKVHHAAVVNEVARLFGENDENKLNLAQIALLIAKLDNPEVDVPAYLAEIDRMAADFRSQLRPEENADALRRVERLATWLFNENGFHGSEDDYYSKSNSYLNEVIDDREGIPITLAVLFIELGRRCDLPIAGISLPGHFIVQFRPEEAPDEGPYFDVFNRGKKLNRGEAEKLVETFTGRPARPADFAPATKPQIIQRMLHNLINIQLQEKSSDALPYLDLFLTLDPESSQERLSRAIVHYQAGSLKEALTDIVWLIEKEPEGIDLRRLKMWRDEIEAKQ